MFHRAIRTLSVITLRPCSAVLVAFVLTLLLCSVNDLVLTLIHIQLGIEFGKSLAFFLKLSLSCERFCNGEEFAALQDAKEEGDESEDDGVYIMKINSFTDENGEEMEEFVPPEEELMEKLIAIVNTRFGGEDDEDEDEE